MQSLADAMRAEAEAAELEAAEADAKRELRNFEMQVNRGEPLDEAQLGKLELLTKQLEGAGDQADDGDEHALLEEKMPDTLGGLVRNLFEVKNLSDLLVLTSMLGALILLVVLVTIPFGSLGFVYGLPHRVAHFFATGGMSAELFVLISLVVAWRAEKWQPARALDWRDFGYAPWFMYTISGMLIALAVWTYITAEIELRKHGHGTLGSMAIRDGGFGITRHPQYFSLPLFVCGVGILVDSRWVFVMLPVNFIYCHSVLIPMEEAWLEETHPELYAEHIRTGACRSLMAVKCASLV